MSTHKAVALPSAWRLERVTIWLNNRPILFGALTISICLLLGAISGELGLDRLIAATIIFIVVMTVNAVTTLLVMRRGHWVAISYTAYEQFRRRLTERQFKGDLRRADRFLENRLTAGIRPKLPETLSPSESQIDNLVWEFLNANTVKTI